VLLVVKQALQLQLGRRLPRPSRLPRSAVQSGLHAPAHLSTALPRPAAPAAAPGRPPLGGLLSTQQPSLCRRARQCTLRPALSAFFRQ
jgi:hypothetical protein